MKRILAIGLDGYEPSLGNTMMADGAMPNLARLRKSSACFRLDHGSAKRTGLAWEHFSSGKNPVKANRWSAVNFNKDTYEVRQEGVRMESFLNNLDARAVVFDLPYIRLEDAPRVRGFTAWGAHDPGCATASNPPNLVAEVKARFGDYPATEWIYGFAWPSVDKCRSMGTALTDAVKLRARISRWIFTERLTDWDLGVLVVSEPHSAAEGLWHGIDPQHPLAGQPSAPVAGEGVRGVYTAIDQLVGDMVEALPDTIIIVFSMHGMGVNESDVPSMALLPELLYRHAFGRSAIRESPCSGEDASLPILGPDEIWDVNVALPPTMTEKLRALLGLRHARTVSQGSLDWMPAARYQPYWHKMRAFALPSFYDGQIRINLRNREAHGLVSLEQVHAVRDEITQLLMDCRNPQTGEKVVREITYHVHCSPLELDSSAADITVVWHGSPLAFQHPKLGRLGPLPFRRPGGHTGDLGVAWIHGAGLEVADRGVHSAFDIVPTLYDLLNQSPPESISGTSMLSPLKSPETLS